MWGWMLLAWTACQDELVEIRSFEEMPTQALVVPGVLREGEASSFYSEGALLHVPGNAGDAQPKTAWCEGASGNGEGEWLTLSASCDGPMVGFQAINGLAESRAIFPQFNRVEQAKLTLFVDDTLVWTETVRFLDQMNKQYLPMAPYECGKESRYRLRVDIEAVGSGNGHACLSEMVPVSVQQREGPSMVRGPSNCRIKTYALEHLRFHAGPGKRYAFLGTAPLYPSRYGAPIVHIVEHQKEWLRVDSTQRFFAENERPAESVDPRWGGWVHASQLSFVPVEEGLYRRPASDAPVYRISPEERFAFADCQGDWVAVKNGNVEGWGRYFCPEERGCF